LPEKTTFLATLSNAATGARSVASKKWNGWLIL
jgi:hypothetical protein